MQNIASENSPSGEVFNYLFFLFFLCVSYLRGNFFVEILDSIKKGFLSFTYENYFTVAHSSRCSPAKMLIVFWQSTHSKNKVCLWLFSFLSYFLIRLIRRFFFCFLFGYIWYGYELINICETLLQSYVILVFIFL